MLQFKMRRVALVTGAALAATALAASTLAAPSSAAGTGDTLTVAASSTPTSLDPMLQSVDQINNMFINVAYDSFTRINNKTGKIVPDLATSWKYTDDSNKVFEMNLRTNVKFSDGSAFTADDAVASIDYARKNGVNKAWLASISSVVAKDANTVVINQSTSNDALPYLLSQRLNFGSVISTKAAATPSLLKTASYGAGPYMLDSSATVANSSYVYVPNPYYWNPSIIKWKKIVIKIVADQNAALQAVQAGTADLFSGNQPTATAARAGGLSVATAPFGITGVQIQDRNGEIVPALKNPLVRQAMFYAIDRTAIANAVFTGFSTPLPTLIIGQQDGYKAIETRIYQYNMNRAKQLLRKAGYEKGFSFNMSVPTANNTHLAAQAVVASWAQLGIKANLTTYTDLGQLTKDILAKKYAVSVFNYGSLPTIIQSASFLNGGATQFNAFNVIDDQVNASLAAGAAASSDKAKNEAYYQAWHRAQVDLAWFTSIYLRDQVTIYNQKKITGVFVNTKNPAVDLAWTVASV